jgi:hypothetical protein
MIKAEKELCPRAVGVGFPEEVRTVLHYLD